MKKKFYAVRKGRRTGIFLAWEECERQVKGYSGAEFKSFKNRGEAENYLSAAKKAEPAQKAETEKTKPKTKPKSQPVSQTRPKNQPVSRVKADSRPGQKTEFYAVIRGRKPGVYASWDACRKQIRQYPYAEFRSFVSRETAELYFAANAKPAAASVKTKPVKPEPAKYTRQPQTVRPSFWQASEKPLRQYTAEGPDYKGIPDAELAGCLRILYRAANSGDYPVSRTPAEPPASSALP